MSTNAVSAISTTTGSYAAAATRLPTQTLDQQDFLTLLATQLSSQDPLNPQKDTDFIAQMAQFSSLEQTRSMQTNLAQLRSSQDILQSNAMIGRAVTVQTSAGDLVQGTVTGLTVESGTPKIIVNGAGYSLSQLRSVSPSVPATN